MIKPTDPLLLMNQFVNAVRINMSKDDTELLLSSEVRSITTTDDGFLEVVGIDKVVAMFQKYIWDNTRNVSIERIKFKDVNTVTPKAKMVITEEKERDGEWKTYKFQIQTDFELTVESAAIVISKMKTTQTQLYTPHIPFSPWESFQGSKS